MSDKLAAKGTLLKRGDGGSPTEAFATIGGITTLTPPNMTAEQIEVSSHDSGGYREFISSFKDSGECTFEMFWDDDDAQHEGLLDDFEGNIKRNFKIYFPTQTTQEVWAFAGYVTAFEVNSSFDAALTASVTIKVSGQVTRHVTP